jgi:glycosyltransferase involved in cell wall biosynthesis
LPVVASRVSVLPHLLSDGCGSLLDGTNAEDVVEGVMRLCREPERMAAMGRAAREKARGYTLERWRDLIGERLEAAWGRPLKGGARDAGSRAGASR